MSDGALVVNSDVDNVLFITPYSMLFWLYCLFNASIQRPRDNNVYI